MSNIALRAIVLAGFCAICITSQMTRAQSGGAPVSAELVARLLHEDIYVEPGKGFKQVQVGQPFEQVAAHWGRPNATRSSFFGLTKYWVYKAGQDSSIIVSGRDKVKGIEVVGGVNSPFQSVEGVKFGMSPYQVTSIYGPPDAKEELVKLEYLSKGITLTFRQGGVYSIYVFKPD